jgi:hypothetical protein
VRETKKVKEASIPKKKKNYSIFKNYRMLFVYQSTKNDNQIKTNQIKFRGGEKSAKKNFRKKKIQGPREEEKGARMGEKEQTRREK